MGEREGERRVGERRERERGSSSGDTRNFSLSCGGGQIHGGANAGEREGKTRVEEEGQKEKWEGNFTDYLSSSFSPKLERAEERTRLRQRRPRRGGGWLPFPRGSLACFFLSFVPPFFVSTPPE